MLAGSLVQATMIEESSYWKELTWVAIDLETSGTYPIGDEICEIAAIKWKNGQIVDELQTLIRIQGKMGASSAIHGISDEMVRQAPTIKEVLPRFQQFTADSVLVGHHIPFDLGFLAYEMEKQQTALPSQPIVCSSLLTQQVFPESPNHRLSTLVDYLGFAETNVHRARIDALNCWRITEKALENIGESACLSDVLAKQGVRIEWSRFSINELRHSDKYCALVESCEQRSRLRLSYGRQADSAGARHLQALGLVRSLKGDFFVGHDLQSESEGQPKRFYLNRIHSSERTIGN